MTFVCECDSGYSIFINTRISLTVCITTRSRGGYTRHVHSFILFPCYKIIWTFPTFGVLLFYCVFCCEVCQPHQSCDYYFGVVVIDRIVSYLKVGVTVCAGTGSVNTGADVDRISVWSRLWGGMFRYCGTVFEYQTYLKTSQLFTSIIPTYPRK